MMQQLVFSGISTDGYTYSCEYNIAFLYESKEKAEEDFFRSAYTALEKYITKDRSYGYHELLFFTDQPIELMNYWYNPKKYKKPNLSIEDYIYLPPTILTLDEWFNEHLEQVATVG